MMNRLTSIMAALGAFGNMDNDGGTARVPYPYTLRERHIRAGGFKTFTKKGPGRRHTQGKGNFERRRARKLRTCSV